MPARDQRLHHGGADRSRPTKHPDPQIPSPCGDAPTSGVRSIRILRCNAPAPPIWATKSSQSKPVRKNFFSILFCLLRLAFAALLSAKGCANILASDPQTTGVRLETSKQITQ